MSELTILGLVAAVILCGISVACGIFFVVEYWRYWRKIK